MFFFKVILSLTNFVFFSAMEVQLGRRLWKTPFPQFSQVNEKIRDNASSWFPKFKLNILHG